MITEHQGGRVRRVIRAIPRKHSSALLKHLLTTVAKWTWRTFSGRWTTSRRDTVIVLARCSLTRGLYGIGFKRTAAHEWTATWSFPVEEEAARRRRYASTRISGSFMLGADFPGCPHCHNRGFFRENCGKVACWDGISSFITCPWCGAQGELRGQITNMDGTTDLG